jgi:hypothetical protein
MTSEKDPWVHKKERYQYQEKTQSEAMKDLTSRGGFSLLNRVGTSLCRSISSVSNINLLALATSPAGKDNQSSKYITP